ncbi:MAG: tetratricopeptide repeat protein [Gammaproteobacteria bacterium]|nr:tetratricopeptide repeat protein [Gammaproteobacteria bacterium]
MNRQQRRRLSKQSRRTGKAKAVANISVPDVLRQAFAFLQGGYPQESIRLYQQILAVDPKHAEALNLCAIAYFQSGEPAQAIRSLQNAVSVQPNYVEAHNNLGNVFKALGKFAEAETAYSKALAINPDYFDAHFNQGILLEGLNRLTEAEDAYRRTYEINPEFWPALFNLGNVLKAKGEFGEAAEIYRQTIERDPNYVDAYINLGSVLHELGKSDEAVTSYQRALELDSNRADAHYNLGIVLQEKDELAGAVAAYQQVLDLDPKHVEARINLGYAWQKLGKLDEAITAYERAIDIEPHHAQTHVNLGDALLERGEPEAAVALCDKYLAQHFGNTAVLGFKAAALGELGNRESVDHLLDFDRFIQPVRLETPAGYASVADFNAALAHHVRSHPTLVSAPASHATRLGKHSGELLDQSKGPIAVLEEIIRSSVKTYMRKLSTDLEHPFTDSRPKNFALTAWGIVLGSKGYQLPHIHPSAWLSGVYYVQVPEVFAEAGNAQAGWIEFGRPPIHFHCKADARVKLFQPEEGLMLLFPSYFYHGTVPFNYDAQRISIAFDILPLPAPTPP